MISSYINRANKTTKTWTNFDQEIQYIKQTLVNNDYSNKTIDEYIKKFLANKHKAKNKKINTTHLDLYYKSQYHEKYNTNECTMKEIIINKNIKRL